MLFIINAPIFTGYGTWQVSPISVRQASNLVRGLDFVSAIGHETTAGYLSLLLGIDIPFNRFTVDMDYGDIALVLWLKERQAEYHDLTIEELTDIPQELVIVERKN